jgi:anti-anti-sigma regulatory factor
MSDTQTREIQAPACHSISRDPVADLRQFSVMRTQVRSHSADRNRAPAAILVGSPNVMMKRKKAKTSRAARSAGAGKPRKVTRSLKTGVAKTRHDAKTAGSHTPEHAPATEYTLGTECLISDAPDLKDKLSGLLEEPQAVTLDVSALERIDTAGLQVIAAFVRERSARALKTEWRGSAPALTCAVRLLGLASVLRLPELAGS